MKLIITRDGKDIGCVDYAAINGIRACDSSIIISAKNDCHFIAFDKLKEQDIENVFSQIRKFNEKVSSFI